MIETSVWQYLGIILFILGSSKIFKMLAKTSENSGNLEQNINLCCIIIWSIYVQRKQIFDKFMISLLDQTENSL